ncbi:MAG: ice-binding family protein [Armatimonadota bacterium]
MKKQPLFTMLGTILGLLAFGLLIAGCQDSGGIAHDTTAPTVIYTIPADVSTNVPINRKITAAFSEVMNPSTLASPAGSFTLTELLSGNAVAGVVTYIDTTATFTPTSNLAADTTYTATVTTGARDLAGNTLANNMVWTFTTGASADTVAPTVSSTTPVNADTGVAVNANITATFTEAMNPVTIASPATSFTLKTSVGGNAVTGIVTYIGTTATFTPTNVLAAETAYTATVTTEVMDLAGNILASDYVWTFTTGTVVHAGPEPVILGSAGDFNILAGSAVSNTDTVSARTTINGLVGVFPGSEVTGLPTSAVPAGQIHAGDTVADLAKVALLAAYNDAASRSVNAISLPGNMGGLTLAPGLYVNSTSSGISGTGANAILTLDAQGDANAVWIFKMGSTLITDPGTSIVLAGNAQAKNIFWQVGSSATLGTNSIFKGNVLADVSITLTTGVNLQGRALTRVGSVSLDTNTITLP